MEVKISNAGFLTNIEVLELINERKQNRNTKQEHDKQNITLIENEVTRYFQVHDKAKHLSKNIKEMLCNIKNLHLNLKENELLTIANLIPTKTVELHVCIDDIENRLKESDLTNILDIIKTTLNINDEDDKNNNDS